MIHRIALPVVGVLLLCPAIGRADEGYLDSNGVKIHYVVRGKGEPVLLIHGFLGDLQMNWVYPGILYKLAKDHRVVALDCRGHGKSGKPHDAKKYGTEMVDDAVRLLDHLKIKKAHIVGYSMGALLTAKLATEHPDRVLSATLGGGGVIPEGIGEGFLDELADAMEKGKGMTALLEMLTPPGKAKATAEQMQAMKRLFAGNDKKALAAVIRGWKDFSVSEKKLKANRVPMLALIGANDPLKPAIEELAPRTGHFRMVVIAGANHFTAFMKPVFLKELTKFLADPAAVPDAPPKRGVKKASPKRR